MAAGETAFWRAQTHHSDDLVRRWFFHRRLEVWRHPNSHHFGCDAGGLPVEGARGGMNPVLVYLLLLKATLTSFSGMASLPMVRNDFVVERHLLTDRQLNTAVVAGRSGPGPTGLYLVSVGYFVSGLPGAAAGLLAVMTPAFLVLPLMTWMSARADSPRVKG